jgi:transposase InsO family protein
LEEKIHVNLYLFLNRISFVFSLRTKDKKFKQFKSLYEVHTNKKIQGLHTDNGKEYMSTEFSKYLKDNGIIHYTAVAYCPQSNGKPERLNQTLIEKARCMMIAAKID